MKLAQNHSLFPSCVPIPKIYLQKLPKDKIRKMLKGWPFIITCLSFAHRGNLSVCVQKFIIYHICKQKLIIYLSFIFIYITPTCNLSFITFLVCVYRISPIIFNEQIIIIIKTRQPLWDDDPFIIKTIHTHTRIYVCMYNLHWIDRHVSYHHFLSVFGTPNQHEITSHLHYIRRIYVFTIDMNMNVHR